MDRQNLILLYKAAIEGEEPDPLGDDVFLNLEAGYVVSMAERLDIGVERIADFANGKVTTTGFTTTLNKEKLYNEVIRMAATELGGKVPADIQVATTDFVNKIYNHARQPITQVALDVKDNVAIQYMLDSDQFYIGNKFGKYAPEVRTLLRETIFEQGLGADQVAKEIKKKLAGLVDGKFYQYENVARTSANRVRNWSRVMAYKTEQTVTLMFIAMMDERTTKQCREMNGRTWDVKLLVDRIEEIIEAGESKIPEIAPFARVNDILNTDGSIKHYGVFDSDGKKKATELLYEQGIALPPLHGRCRSVLGEI